MIYEFDRYVNGIKMAEDVAVERAETFEEAVRKAARIANKGPNGQTPVLVLRMPDEILKLREELNRLRKAVSIVLDDDEGDLKFVQFKVRAALKEPK